MRVRRRWLVVAAVVAVALLGTVQAQAITVDNGWTQLDNNGYGNGGDFSGSPNCYPHCAGWPLGATVTYAEDTNVPFYPTEEGYAIARWNNARWFYATAYSVQNDSLGKKANVHGVMSSFLASSLWANTSTYYR